MFIILNLIRFYSIRMFTHEFSVLPLLNDCLVKILMENFLEIRRDSAEIANDCIVRYYIGLYSTTVRQLRQMRAYLYKITAADGANNADRLTFNSVLGVQWVACSVNGRSWMFAKTRGILANEFVSCWPYRQQTDIDIRRKTDRRKKGWMDGWISAI